MTTIVPTAVAACAALGDGGSPVGFNLPQALQAAHYRQALQAAHNRQALQAAHDRQAL